MHGTPQTVVVVPCFNEAARLRTEEFVAARNEFPDIQFLFVDDGSSDDTAHVLETLAARDPYGLHCLMLSENRGKAEAVRQGMLHAFEMQPAFVGFLDADLATPIAELPLMAAAFANADVLAVLAARVAMLGRNIQRSRWRHYSGRVFATFASLILGLQVYDTQCGAKLFRNVDAVRRLFDRPFLSSWAFDVEILARLVALNRDGQIRSVRGTVVEVPLRQWVDVPGSKIGLLSSLRAGMQLLPIWWRYRS